jgi:hypothetical protein
MLAGPALSAFAIFHSSECVDVVNVPGGNRAVADDRSSAKEIEDITANPIAAHRAVLTMGTSSVFCLGSALLPAFERPL